MRTILSFLAVITNVHLGQVQMVMDHKENGFLAWASDLFTSQQQSTKEQACICGVQGTKIVGGTETRRNEFPWMAAMYYNENFRCGASLINDRFVVTAAHCIYRLNFEDLKIFLGAYDLSKKEKKRVMKNISKIFIHPDYNTRTHVNDMALLEFDKPVKFTDGILPICLPSSPTFNYDGKNVTVLGWGRTKEGGAVTKILNKVDVPIVPHSDCQEAYGLFKIDCKKMLCAGLEEGGKDSCQGDSGGPMVMKNEFHSVLVGVVSFGEGCARPGKPGVYTKVDAFLPFIFNNTEGAFYCPAYRG